MIFLGFDSMSLFPFDYIYNLDIPFDREAYLRTSLISCLRIPST